MMYQFILPLDIRREGVRRTLFRAQPLLCDVGWWVDEWIIVLQVGCNEVSCCRRSPCLRGLPFPPHLILEC